MKPFLITFVCSCLMFSSSYALASAKNQPEKPIEFTAQSGEMVNAFQGSFSVAENSSSPASRKLTLQYVRFPATGDKPRAPIVYLAGGPGGSGIQTAKSRRFPLFMAMREFGDVIALDQRGTGASNDIPKCKSSKSTAQVDGLPDSAFLEIYRQAFKECLSFWQGKGIDHRGYTTLHSVADLEALRMHLKADKLTLWGISYGTHLALAASKTMSDRLDKLVLASAEGMTQTIKQPARTDDYFERLQTALNEQASTNKNSTDQNNAADDFTDIKGLIKRVHSRLDESPIKITLTSGDAEPKQMLLQRRTMQLLASAMISDPTRAIQLLSLYQAVDHGVTAPLAPILAKWFDPHQPISFNLMSEVMDLASGISTELREAVIKQAESSLLAGYLNFTLHLLDIIPNIDLGDEFRERPKSSVATLLLSGTLDGRTYIESQREAVSELSNITLITVKNAGHNLFMSSPKVTNAIQNFMRNSPVDEAVIEVALPNN